MTITLSVLDPRQVASATQFEALVGEPALRLLILSGIAIPDYWTNHDEEERSDEVVVRLGVFVAALDGRPVVNVGLASIENDESTFRFALEEARVELEAGSGELILRVRVRILGDETWLHRFGYQIVAHVRRARAQISGVIGVPRDILDVAQLKPDEVKAAFEITANRVERGGSPGGFAFDTLIKVADGATGGVRQGTEGMAFVDYTIDGCPFATPLVVEVKPAGERWPGSIAIAQVAGPRPVSLTGTAPDASGIDFAVGRFAPVR